MSHKLRLTFIHLEQLSLMPAPARLAHRLLMIAEGYGEIDPPRRPATAPGRAGVDVVLSRQTTNQLLKDLQGQGILSLGYGEIEILDATRLGRRLYLKGLPAGLTIEVCHACAVSGRRTRDRLLLANGLSEAGYAVDVAVNGMDGRRFHRVRRIRPDHPRRHAARAHGWQLLQQIRKLGETPVLFLTTRAGLRIACAGWSCMKMIICSSRSRPRPWWREPGNCCAAIVGAD
jgi:hypothetical protein